MASQIEQATLTWKGNKCFHRQADGRVICKTYPEPLWWSSTGVQESETAPKAPLQWRELIKCPNVSIIEAIHQKYIGPTISSNLYHSTSQTFITVGKHMKNMIALACPELVSCVAL